MPMTLWLKAGMMCPWKKVNCGRGVDQDDTDFCTFHLDFPTMTGGTFMLRLPQGDSIVMYMPLAPASEIDISLG